MKALTTQGDIMRLLVLAALGFGLLAPELRAQEEAPKPVKFTADLGFVSTAGNTEVTNLNAGEKVEWNLAPITLKEGFAIVYGETDGNTTTSSLRADLRADYALSAPLAIFGAFAFDRNRFAGIARRFEENVGLAFKPIRGDRDKLEFEAGVSFNQQRSILEVSDNFTAARAAGMYRHGFTESAYIQQSVEVLPNLEVSEDLRINTETALVAPLSKRLAIKLSYTIRYDKLPEPGFKKTDRVFASGLQINL
jgi:putative salt-induced outer membrane protein